MVVFCTSSLRWTVQEAQLQEGETLQATAGHVRIEIQRQGMILLRLLKDQPEVDPRDSNAKKMATIEMAKTIAAEVDVQNLEELKHLYHLLLRATLATPCLAVGCAEMMHGLTVRYPEFPPVDGHEVPMRAIPGLASVMQGEFKNLPVDGGLASRNFRTAWVRVFAELVLRGLIPVKTSNQILAQLTETSRGIHEEWPEECAWVVV